MSRLPRRRCIFVVLCVPLSISFDDHVLDAVRCLLQDIIEVPRIRPVRVRDDKRTE